MADQPAITIRLASPRDAEALAHLRYEFRAAIDDATETEAEFVERCARWMESHLADRARWRCWAALEGERIVGMAWVHLIEKVPNPVVEPEAHGYITSLYVREHLRGAGVDCSLLRSTGVASMMSTTRFFGRPRAVARSMPDSGSVCRSM
jgi:hypothetical protein